MARFGLFLVFLFQVFALSSCNGDRSINDLYKFAGTKDILVQVSINLFSNGNSGFPIDFSNRSLILNSYILDGGGEQVQIMVDGSDFVRDLPVTLNDPSLTFPGTLRIPVTAVAGASGYALRFQLRDQNTSLLDTGSTNMDAMRGDIQAGTDAATNNVDLTLASTIAYKYLSTSSNLTSTAAVSAYNDILALVEAKQKIIEDGLDDSQTPSFSSFIAAIKAGLNYQVLTDTSFQQKIADAVLKTTDSTPAALENVAKNFASTLLTAAVDVSAALSDASSAIAKVFTSGFIDTATIPEPASFSNAVFAPASISFTDSDSSAALSGDIVVTAPLIQSGVAAYRIYFGGEDKASTKTFIGEVASGSTTSTFTLTSVTQPTDATRFWVYPVASSVQMDVPASVGIVNLGGVNKAPNAPTGLAVAISGFQAAITWNSVTGANSYNIYWSTTQPVRQASNRIKSVSSGYIQKNLLPSTSYYYAVTAVKNGIESVLSAEATAATGPATGSISAPTNLVATAGIRKVSLSWTTGGGSAGYVVVRRKGTAVTWQPTDGQTYTAGQAPDANHRIALVVSTTAGDAVNIDSSTQHFAVYAYSSSKKYSTAVTGSATVVGGKWAWLTGLKATPPSAGNWGTKGVTASTNTPGNRINAATCAQGNTLYLYGGIDDGSTGPYLFYADLWKFDGSNWTWIAGSSTAGQAAVYGTKGVASSSNTPGIRASPSCKVDSSGKIWLFGGSNNTSMTTPYFNDLWKFDGSNWTWVSGANTNNNVGVYGSKGVTATSSYPGSRNDASMVIDSHDNIWIGFGDGYDSVMKSNDPLQDLWKFDGTSWTWMAGVTTISNSTTPGVYGTKGVKSSSNYPSGRSGISMAIDAKDRIWLLGGNGNDSTNQYGALSDLWKFDGADWTWVSGTNLKDTAGVAGTQGTAASTHVLPGRANTALWFDTEDNLWVFGGDGMMATFLGGGNPAYSDLWKFDGSNWTWVSGTLQGDQNSTYDTAGTFSATATPGGLMRSTTWVDADGFFRIFGGSGLASAGYPETLFDTWKYNP